MTRQRSRLVPALAAGLALVAAAALAHQPGYTANFDRSRCTFTTVGDNPYLPLWPGHQLRLEGEERDGNEVVEVAAEVTILADTAVIDGVRTRVLEEREWEDDELVEVSRNFVAVCRETGDVWYFGEDVDDYEDGEIVGHGGAWRAGVAGAKPGVLMLGSPVAGARHFQEVAPGVALDRAEVISVGGSHTVPAGTFTDVLRVVDSNALSPGGGSGDLKIYAPGVGLIVDEALELVEVRPAPCAPGRGAQCLADGRLRVSVRFHGGGGTRPGRAVAIGDHGGAYRLDDPDALAVAVALLDGCSGGAGGLGIAATAFAPEAATVIVFDTLTEAVRAYHLPAGDGPRSVSDPAAFVCQ